jgi:hypothetical protein
MIDEQENNKIKFALGTALITNFIRFCIAEKSLSEQHQVKMQIGV